MQHIKAHETCQLLSLRMSHVIKVKLKSLVSGSLLFPSKRNKEIVILTRLINSILMLD